jgi:hypothetical protein
MREHYQRLDKTKQLYSLCVWMTVLLMFSVTSALGGSVEGDLNNNYENSTVDSNNDTVNNNYNATGAGSPAPVMSAIAPTVMGGGGNDSCLMPRSGGVSLSIVGVSAGNAIQDEHCNRRKNARLLGAPQAVGGLGLQVSAISVLCQDPTVFRSMMLANTPCPISDTKTGKLLMGKAAINKYRENPAQYVVGYKRDRQFWDTLLRVGEEDYEEEVVEDTGPKLSISDRFRTSKQRTRTNGSAED